ncbi:MAG: DUF1564 family protein [Leptospiraceae bacterium]|nr:DUF1564 family protein [Leptospiraceae bacterium]
MEFNEYLKEKLAQATEDYFGIYADGYENGKNASENTKRFPREKNPLIEINSTLLIPEKYYKKFMEKVVYYQGVRAYVAHLLFKYKIHIANGLVPSYRNHTTKYQEKNQNLIKVAFRPNLDDWAELKLYRACFGISISAFFVYLLIADSVDFAQKISYFLGAVGIPVSSSFDLWAKVHLSRKNQCYTTIFQYRNSRDG